MWQLWQLSKSVQTRPSELIGLLAPYTSYCFDEAVVYLGQYIEVEMEKASRPRGKQRKAQRAAEKQQNRASNRLRAILGMEQKFADPTKKV